MAKLTLNIHVSDSFLPTLVSPMLSHRAFCPGYTPPAVVNLASGYGKVTAEVLTIGSHSLLARSSAHVSEKHCDWSQPVYVWREGGRERGREGGREGEREGGREGGREGEREGEREKGERERKEHAYINYVCVYLCVCMKYVQWPVETII